MVTRTLSFGTMLKWMMFIRGESPTDLADKADMPADALMLLRDFDLFDPKPELEEKLRRLLDWPHTTDELLTIVHLSKRGDENPDLLTKLSPVPFTQPTAFAQPEPQSPSPAVPVPLKPKPSELLRKAQESAPPASPNRKPWSEESREKARQAGKARYAANPESMRKARAASRNPSIAPAVEDLPVEPVYDMVAALDKMDRTLAGTASVDLNAPIHINRNEVVG